MQASFLVRRPIVSGTLALSALLIMPVVFVTTANASTLTTLSTFLSQLESKHPRLKASQAEIEATQARTRAASRPLYNPEIELDGERVGFKQNNVNTITIGINQTIDWHDKRAARKNIATVGQQLTRYEQAAVRQEVISRIFSALADYQIQREVIQSYNKRLSLTQQVLDQATQLYQAGEISKLDLEQVRLSKAQTQLSLNQAKTILATYSQTLSATAAETREIWPALPYSPPRLGTKKINYEQILTNLPMLKAQTTQVAQARSIMRLRVREQKSDPTIGLRAGGENGDNSDKVIGFTLSIPLNIRNNYQAEVGEASANIRRAESMLENTKQRLRSQLQSTAQSYQLTYSGWKSWQKVAGNSLKQQSQLLMRLWKAGELSTSDYLLQLKQIKAAELNHIELKGNVWKAWFNWLATSNQFKQWLNGQFK
jgi:cobalt-zinc-cadmium efflux system outer membrane protein